MGGNWVEEAVEIKTEVGLKTLGEAAVEFAKAQQRLDEKEEVVRKVVEGLNGPPETVCVLFPKTVIGMLEIPMTPSLKAAIQGAALKGHADARKLALAYAESLRKTGLEAGL